MVFYWQVHLLHLSIVVHVTLVTYLKVFLIFKLHRDGDYRY